MKTRVYIRNVVGSCPVCLRPILDAGWTDDPNGYAHSHPVSYNVLGPHYILYGACTFTLSR